MVTSSKNRTSTTPATIEPINNFETNNRNSSLPHDGARRDRADPRLSRGEKPIGRYDRRTHNTRHPGQGLARAPLAKVTAGSEPNVDVTVAAVEDPMGDGRERLYVTVNRKVDILEQERSHDRISEAAYQTGRLMQEMFERSGRVGGTNWAGASRRDPRLVQSETIARGIDNARAIAAFAVYVRGQIGERNLRILRRVLGERMSFAEVASLEGKSGPRGQAFITETFRVALEDAVGAVQQARGKVNPVPDDKHKDAALTMDGRQDESLVAGATLERLESEAEELRGSGNARKVDLEDYATATAVLRLKRGMAAARVQDRAETNPA